MIAAPGASSFLRGFCSRVGVEVQPACDADLLKKRKLWLRTPSAPR
jgi:hypothetical protein